MKIQPEYQAALMKNQMERQKRQEERLRRKEGKPDQDSDEIRIPDSTKLDSVSVLLSYTHCLWVAVEATTNY